MATRQSTRGKTKTTKSAAAKSSAKKTTSKVTASAAASTTKKTVTSTNKSKRTSKLFDGMTRRRLQIISLVVFVLLGVAAGTLMKATTYPITLGHMGRDSLASRTETVYAAAREPIFDIEIRWVLVTILGVAAIFSALYLTRLTKAYEDSLNTKVFKWRWIEMAITSALMVELVAVLSGADELMTLKLIGGLMVTTAALGWLAERAVAAGRSARATFFTSIFTAVLPWLLIFGYAVATVVYGSIRYGWYVYALYAVMLLGGILVVRNVRRSMSGQKFEVTDRAYNLTALVTKAAFALVLIIGLKR